jgi:hypothetical protein
MLKIIPLTKPGVPGLSYTLARTDADEATARKNAAAQGLLVGEAMPTKQNPQFWSFIHTVKSR